MTRSSSSSFFQTTTSLIVTITITQVLLLLLTLLSMNTNNNNKHSCLVQALSFSCSALPSSTIDTALDIEVDLSGGCSLTITGGSVGSLTVTGTHSTSELIIDGLTCTSNDRSCITVNSTVGNIEMSKIRLNSITTDVITNNAVSLFNGLEYRSVIDFAKDIDGISTYLRVNALSTGSNFGFSRGSGQVLTMHFVRFAGQISNTPEVSVTGLTIRGTLIASDSDLFFSAVFFAAITAASDIQINVVNVNFDGLTVQSSSSTSATWGYGVLFALNVADVGKITCSRITATGMTIKNTLGSGTGSVSFYGVRFKGTLSSVAQYVHVEKMNFDDVEFSGTGPATLIGVWAYEAVSNIPDFKIQNIKVKRSTLRSSLSISSLLMVQFENTITGIDATGLRILNVAVSDTVVSSKTGTSFAGALFENTISSADKIEIQTLSVESSNFTAESNAVNVHGVDVQKQVTGVSASFLVEDIAFRNCTITGYSSSSHYAVQFHHTVHDVNKFTIRLLSTSNMVYSAASGYLQIRGLSIDRLSEIGSSSTVYASGFSFTDSSFFYQNSFAFATTSISFYALEWKSTHDSGAAMNSNFFRMQNISVGRQGFSDDEIDVNTILPFADAYAHVDPGTTATYLPQTSSSTTVFTLNNNNEDDTLYKSQLYSTGGAVAVYLFHTGRVVQHLRAYFLAENCSISHMRIESRTTTGICYAFVFTDDVGYLNGGFLMSRVHVIDVNQTSAKYSDLRVLRFDSEVSHLRAAPSGKSPLSDATSSFHVADCRMHNINTTGLSTARVWAIALGIHASEFTNFTSAYIARNIISSVSANATGGWASLLVFHPQRNVSSAESLIVTENSAELLHSNASLSSSYIMYSHWIKSLETFTFSNNQLTLNNVRQDTGTNPATQASGFIGYQNSKGFEDLEHLKVQSNTIVIESGGVWGKTQCAIGCLYSSGPIQTIGGMADLSSNKIEMKNGGKVHQDTTTLSLFAVFVKGAIDTVAELRMRFNQIDFDNGVLIRAQGELRISNVVLQGTISSISTFTVLGNRMNLYGTGGKIEQTETSSGPTVQVMNFRIEYGEAGDEVRNIGSFLVERNTILFRQGFEIESFNTQLVLVANYMQSTPIRKIDNSFRILENSIGGQVSAKGAIKANSHANISSVTFEASVEEVEVIEISQSQIANMKVTTPDSGAGSIQAIVFEKSLSNPTFSSSSNVTITTTSLDKLEMVCGFACYAEALSFTGGYDYTLSNFSAVIIKTTHIRNLNIRMTSSISTIFRHNWHAFLFYIRVDSIGTFSVNKTSYRSDMKLSARLDNSFQMLMFGSGRTTSSGDYGEDAKVSNISTFHVYSADVDLNEFYCAQTSSTGSCYFQMVRFDVPFEVASSGSSFSKTNIYFSRLNAVLRDVSVNNADLFPRFINFEEGIVLPPPSSSSSSFGSSLLADDCSLLFAQDLSDQVKDFTASMLMMKDGLAGLRGGKFEVNKVNFNSLAVIDPKEDFVIVTAAVTNEVSGKPLDPDNEMELVSITNCDIKHTKDVSISRGDIAVHHLFTTTWGLANVKTATFSNNKIDLSAANKLAHEPAETSKSIVISSVYLSPNINNISNQLSITNTDILLPSAQVIGAKDVIVNFLNTVDIHNVSRINLDSNKIQLSQKQQGTNRRIRIYAVLANQVRDVSSFRMTNVQISPQTPIVSTSLAKIVAESTNDANVSCVRFRDEMKNVDNFLIDGCTISAIYSSSIALSSVTIASFSGAVQDMQSLVISNSRIDHMKIEAKYNVFLSTVLFHNQLKDISDNVSIISCHISELQTIGASAGVPMIVHTNFYTAAVSNVNKILVRDASITQSTTEKRGPGPGEVSLRGESEVIVSMLRNTAGFDNVNSVSIVDAVFNGTLMTTSGTDGDVKVRLVDMVRMQDTSYFSVENVSAVGIKVYKKTTLVNNDIHITVAHLVQMTRVDTIFLSNLNVEYLGHQSAQTDRSCRAHIRTVLHYDSPSLFCKNYTIQHINSVVENAPTQLFYLINIDIMGSVTYIDDLTIRHINTAISNSYVAGHHFRVRTASIRSNHMQNFFISDVTTSATDITSVASNSGNHLVEITNVCFGSADSINITKSIKMENLFAEVGNVDFNEYETDIANAVFWEPASTNHDGNFYLQGDGITIKNTTLNVIPGKSVLADGATTGLYNVAELHFSGVRFVQNLDGCANASYSSYSLDACSSSATGTQKRNIDISDIKLLSIDRSDPSRSELNSTIAATKTVNISLVRFDGAVQNFESSMTSFSITNVYINGSSGSTSSPFGAFQIESGLMGEGTVFVSAVNFASTFTNVSCYYSSPSLPAARNVVLLDHISIKNIFIKQRSDSFDQEKTSEIVLVLFRGLVASSLPSSESSSLAPRLYRGIQVSNAAIENVQVNDTSMTSLHVLHFRDSVINIQSVKVEQVSISNTHLLQIFHEHNAAVVGVDGNVDGATNLHQSISPSSSHYAPSRHPMHFFTINLVDANITLQRTPKSGMLRRGYLLSSAGASGIRNIGSNLNSVDQGLHILNSHVKVWFHSGNDRYPTYAGQAASESAGLILIVGDVDSCTKYWIKYASVQYGADYVSDPALVDKLKSAVTTRYLALARSQKTNNVASIYLNECHVKFSSVVQSGVAIMSYVLLVPNGILNSDGDSISGFSLKVQSSSIDFSQHGFETYDPVANGPDSVTDLIGTRDLKNLAKKIEIVDNTIKLRSSSCLRSFHSSMLRVITSMQDIHDQVFMKNNGIQIKQEPGSEFTTATTPTFNYYDYSTLTPFSSSTMGTSVINIVAGVHVQGLLQNVHSFYFEQCWISAGTNVNSTGNINFNVFYHSSTTNAAHSVGSFTMKTCTIGPRSSTSSTTRTIISTAKSNSNIFFFAARFDLPPQNFTSLEFYQNSIAFVNDVTLYSQGTILAAILRVPRSPDALDSSSVTTSLYFHGTNKIAAENNVTIITSKSSLFRLRIYDVRDLSFEEPDSIDPEHYFAPPLYNLASRIQGTFHFSNLLEYPGGTEPDEEISPTIIVGTGGGGGPPPLPSFKFDAAINSAPTSFPNKTSVANCVIDLTISTRPSISYQQNTHSDFETELSILRTTFFSYNQVLTLSEYATANPLQVADKSLNVGRNSITLGGQSNSGSSSSQLLESGMNVRESIISFDPNSNAKQGVIRTFLQNNWIYTKPKSPSSTISVTSLSSSIIDFTTNGTQTQTLFWDFDENGIYVHDAVETVDGAIFSMISNKASSSSTSAVVKNSFADPENGYDVKIHFIQKNTLPDPSSTTTNRRSKMIFVNEGDDVSMLNVEIGCNDWHRVVDKILERDHGTSSSSLQMKKLNFTCVPTKTKSHTMTLIPPTTSSTTTSTTTTTNTSTTTTTTNTSTATTTNITNSTTTSSSTPISSSTTSSRPAPPPPQPPQQPKTPSKSRTISVLPPTPPPPTPPPVQVSPESSGITSTAVVLGTVAANPAVGPLMVRNGLILLGGSCGESLGPLDFATSPTGLKIGGDDYAWWNGAVVGNFAIVVGSFPVLLGLSSVYAIYVKKKKWDEYLTGVRAICGTFWIVLSGPMIVGFIASYSFSKEGAETFGILVLGIITCAVTIVWPLYIIRRVNKEMEIGEADEGEGRNATEKEKKASIVTRVKSYLFDSRNGKEWMPLLHELRLGWAFLFEFSASLGYIALEVLCGFSINVTLALMQDPGASDTACKLRSLANLALHVPPTLFLIFWNPLFSRFDLVVTTAMWIGNTFTSLMLVMKIFKVGLPIDETLYAFGLVLAVLNLFASLGLAFDMYIMLRMLAERKKLGDDFDAYQGMQNGKKKNNNMKKNTNLQNLEEPMLSIDEELQEFFQTNNSNSNSNRSGSQEEAGEQQNNNNNNNNIVTIQSDQLHQRPNSNSENNNTNLDDDDDIDLTELLEEAEGEIEINNNNEEENVNLEVVLGSFSEEYPELESALATSTTEDD